MRQCCLRRCYKSVNFTPPCICGGKFHNEAVTPLDPHIWPKPHMYTMTKLVLGSWLLTSVFCQLVVRWLSYFILQQSPRNAYWNAYTIQPCIGLRSECAVCRIYTQNVALKTLGPVAWLMSVFISISACSSINSGTMVGSRWAARMTVSYGIWKPHHSHA